MPRATRPSPAAAALPLAVVVALSPWLPTGAGAQAAREPRERRAGPAANQPDAMKSTSLVADEPPFAVHSAFWPNLHQALWAEVNGLDAPLDAPLSATERTAWHRALAYYKEEIADLHPLFEMGPIRAVLVAADVALPAAGLEPGHRQALEAAAPVFRTHAWPARDRANRAWAADTLAKVASLSPAVPDRLADLFGNWLTSAVRVDVVGIAASEGAFSSLTPAPGHITISSASPVLTDWTAAEILLHEASHLLALPLVQAFAAELKAQNKQSRDLWHVALFVATGEVVREALAARGIAYEPYLYRTGLFDRAWPALKAPIETHWRAFVDGKIPRDEAIRRVVAAMK